jgi:signal transduction histidine kinase
MQENGIVSPLATSQEVIKEGGLVDYLLETHEDCVFLVCGNTFEVLRANDAACRFLKTDRLNIIHKSIFDVLPFTLYENTVRDIKNCNKDNTNIDINIREDNDLFSLKVSAFLDDLFFSVKKLTQKSDSIEEKNFKLLFENMSSGFVYLKVNFDESGEVVGNEIVDVNSMFEMFFSVERDEILGKRFEDVLPDIDSRVFHAVNLTAKTGRSRSCNFDYKPAKKYFQVSTYSPRQGYTAVIFNDLKAELEIRNDLKVKSKISKAFAMGHSTDVYKVVLELVLETTQSKFGYVGYFSRKGDIVCFARFDNMISVIVDDDGYERIKLKKDLVSFKCMASGKQTIGYNVSGHRCLLVTPVTDRDGNIIGMIGVSDAPRGYDFRSKSAVQELADYIAPLMISEVKDRNYKRDLIEAKERAEAGEKLKSNFLKNISHEIRTPANIIMGNCELLQKRADYLKEEHKPFFNEIYNHTLKLVYIVDAIKNLAKIENNQVSVFKTRTNLNLLVDNVKRKWDFEAKNKDLYINVEKTLEGDDAIVLIDAQKVKSIIEALVTNGIRFTHTGGITIKYVLEDGNLIFSVTDTGEGIQKERQKSIFEPFEQNNKEKDFMRRTSGGVGLGLTISKGFADVMGGEMWLDSEPQKGSTFYLKVKYEKFVVPA